MKKNRGLVLALSAIMTAAIIAMPLVSSSIPAGAVGSVPGSSSTPDSSSGNGSSPPDPIITSSTRYIVETTPTPPTVNLSILSAKKHTINAGEETAIRVPLFNSGNGAVGSVTGRIQPHDKLGMDISEVVGLEKAISGQGSGILVVKIKVPENTPSGNYTVNASIKYNSSGKSTETSIPIDLLVNSNVRAKALNITDYSVDKDIVAPEDIFNVSITLTNDTGLDVDNAEFTMEGLDGKKFGMNSGLVTRNISMKDGESVRLDYNLIATEGLESIREVIPVKIKYNYKPGDSTTEVTNAQSITIPCKPKAKSESTTTASTQKLFAPSVIIESYSFGGDVVKAGSTFPLDVVIKNTSSDTAVTGLKVVVQGAAGVGEKAGIAYTPANSANSFFFENLAPGEARNINIVMKARADAIPDSYPIEVVCDYQFQKGDQKDKADTVTNKIAIPLQQDDRLSVDPPEAAAEGVVGQEYYLSTNIVNKGKSAVYNVSVNVEGEGFDTTASAYYVGNVESGKQEYYDTKIIPKAAGQVKGNIVVSYEDANGESKEIKREFVFNASEMKAGGMDGMGGMGMVAGGMEGGEMSIPTDGKGAKEFPVLLVVIGGVAVVAAVVTTIVIVRKSKAKKLKLMQESDDDAAD